MAFLTLQTQQIPDWNQSGSTATLRIYSSQAFYEATTGELIPQGQVGNLQSCYQTVACTVAGGVVTIPSVTLATTTDSTVANALYTALLYPANGGQPYPLLQNFFCDSNFLQSPAVAGLYLTSGSISGVYVPNGTSSGKNYYNILDEGVSTTIRAVKWTGSAWLVTDATAATLYTSSDAVATPDLVTTWTLSTGVSPLPVFTNVQVATWEQLTLSNQASATAGIPYQFQAPFWDVTQTKQYINSLIGTGTTPFASALVAGKTRLDVNPVLASAPIAVGTNSPRVEQVLSLDYGNSLATAISTIGSTPTLLYIKSNTTLSTSVTVPATLVLAFENGAVITKSGSGAIAFQGLGLQDAESIIPIFSGFSSGNITFTGSTFPQRLSASLWADTKVSARLNNAINALSGKVATIVGYPGDLNAKVTVLTGLSVELSPGEYTNSQTGANNYTFILQDNTNLYGTPAATLYENAASTRIIYASGVETAPFDVQNTNIHVWGFTIKGDPAAVVDSATSAVFLGNIINGSVRNMIFNDTHGFHAYAGAFATIGAYTSGVFFTDNLVISPRTQSIGLINGSNFVIARNIFRNIQPEMSDPFATIIDVEPNAAGEIINNGLIADNVFDGSGAQQNWNGIVVQAGGSDVPAQNIRVSGNIIIGEESGSMFPRQLSNGITLGGSGLIVENNIIRGCAQTGISCYFSRQCTIRNNSLYSVGGGGIEGFRLQNVVNSEIRDNIIDNDLESGSTSSLILETEVVGVVNTSGTTVTKVSGAISFVDWLFNGATVRINGVNYVVNVVTNATTLVLLTSAGTQSNVAISTVSSNRYYGNRATVLQSSVSNSQILSTEDDQQITNVADAGLAANANTGLVVYTSLTGPRTVTLPTAVGLRGKVMGFKDGAGTAGTNNITIDAAGTETIDGALTFVINSNYGEVWIKSDGANWLTIAGLPSNLNAARIGGGTVGNTEYGYLDGVTSAIQTQLDAKAPSVSPTFTTPDLGTPSAGVLTNCTGTAAALTAGHVTTNANLTGDVTSAGNATTAAFAFRKEVTADVTGNSGLTMANLTDLTVTLAASGVYVGEMVVKCNDSTAAEGVAFDFDGGALTATAFAAGAGVVTGGTTVTSVTTSTALATDLIWTTITGETWINIRLALTVNAGGTFIPRFAQGTAHTSGTVTVSRGSYLWLQKV